MDQGWSVVTDPKSSPGYAEDLRWIRRRTLLATMGNSQFYEVKARLQIQLLPVTTWAPTTYPQRPWLWDAWHGNSEYGYV